MTTLSDRDLDDLLAAADPLPAAHARALPLAEAVGELGAAIPTPGPRRARRPRLRGGHAGRRLAAVTGIAVAAAVGVALLPSGGGDRPTIPGPAPAFAAELVRFAEASPLVLLDEPGWAVTYADEQSRIDGEMNFASPGSSQPSDRDPRAAATLSWRSGSLESWTSDRANSAAVTTTAPVLRTTAHVYQYGGRGQGPGRREITALWLDEGRVLEFRAQVPDMEAFKARLARLQRVDATTWLSALPASAVKAADHGSAVTGMLEGVPVPPGFTPADVRDQGLTQDRYQLGFAVTRAVSCAWVNRWQAARDAGEVPTRDAAIAAMDTARTWPILREMEASGAWPSIIYGYARAMRTGKTDVRSEGAGTNATVAKQLGC